MSADVYDIHGLCTITVASDVPARSVLEETFRHFAVEGAGGPGGGRRLRIVASVDEVVAGEVARRGGARGPGYVSGGSWFVLDDRSLAARSDGEDLIAGSDGNIDRAVLFLLDWLLLDASVCLVHTAIASVNGHGVLISGWGGVGKTATLARLCRADGGAFIADDMGFISEAGRCLSLPKPMYVYPYHRDLFPELFAGRHKPLVPPAATRQVERIRRRVRPLFELDPRLENWARRHTPEHMKTDPTDALPGVPVEESAPVDLVIRLERTSPSGTEIGVEVVEPSEAVNGLVHEFVHEVADIPGFRPAFAATSAGIRPLSTWLNLREEILNRAVDGSTCVRVSVPEGVDGTATAEAVAQIVRTHTSG